MSERTVRERDIALFFLGWRGFTDTADAVLGESGLGRVHHRVLYLICRRPGIGVGQLAGVLGISRQALHRPLADLERGGLVRRDTAPHSARERVLTATAKGRALERSATRPQLDQLEAAFAAAGPESAQGWRDVMAALAPLLPEETG
ncbi:MarR family winged helix-turn-helix transcriptional regulator [Allokutzneria sp. NRRL B-24872]|uniref:MarR family winged helix-turn-helix transcriptional regulator n=1 Tax=Allokutzneria sp. NRRL B-24872 TaxID=1137961 RepID=UPI000A3A5EDD|nr:MarR family winged helix-turn-helix transcriptional regulator [Allokutzneria sp. NRRL B-24872]